MDSLSCTLSKTKTGGLWALRTNFYSYGQISKYKSLDYSPAWSWMCITESQWARAFSEAPHSVQSGWTCTMPERLALALSRNHHSSPVPLSTRVPLVQMRDRFLIFINLDLKDHRWHTQVVTVSQAEVCPCLPQEATWNLEALPWQNPRAWRVETLKGSVYNNGKGAFKRLADGRPDI